MSNWTDGYVADIGYTFGYYTELNPLRVKHAFTHAGLVAPECVTACELGFGQGVSANIHAAASITTWHGTDFNPSQASFAQELANVSGSGAKLYDNAFAQFTKREDLPEFDYIGIHGIWSWVSDENRAELADFIRRKLKVGGVLYISYNTLPGWATFAPMRHLMTEHAQTIGVQGNGIVSRIDGAIDFAEKLLATNPTFARANPIVADRLGKLKDQNRHYLAHEYFNRDWHPMHFATMAKWLEPAKVSYACSANYLDHVENINLNDEQQMFLRQTVRDFMVNQQFRKDYWVKGARQLNALEQAEALRQQKVILIAYHQDISLNVSGALGEATMNENVYNPILEALSDYKSHTLGQLEHLLKDKGITFGQIKEATLLLTGKGAIAPVQDESVAMKVKKSTDKLNLYLMNKARSSSDITYLASPITGGAVNVNRFPQLFLLAISQGKKKPADWAEYAWQVLAAQGQKIVKDDSTLATSEENVAELLAQANIFAEKQLPILKALQVI